MKNLFLILFLTTALISKGFSQVITVTPPLPNDQNSVEVIFDATQGSGGLAGYTGDVYAHTGVITNLSTSSSDWKHVKADWGVNIPDCKLTSLGNNLWKLLIGPSIRSYYNVPAGEEIQKLAFVFRSGVQVSGSWLEGKTSENGDIFYDVFPASLGVKITNPSDNFIFLNLNNTLSVEVSSQLADSTLLFVNGEKVSATTANVLNYTLTASDYGRFLVKAVAKTASASVADSFYYYVRPTPPVAELPAGMKDGINYLSSTSVLLSLYAPLKQSAFVIGDFNNWLPDDAGYMNRTPDGKRYWIEIDGLIPGKEYIYQYLVDEGIRIGDPYAEKVSDPWNDSYITSAHYPGMLPYPTGKTTGIATVLQTDKAQYTWKASNFTPPKQTDMVVYELLVRDFSTPQTFQAVIDTIGYLWKLGVNAIELMPVSEFEGNLSWGYNPNFYFAVDKYYGPADKLKQLIDTCHQMGIAVIDDIVLNHAFGTSPYVMLYWDNANNRPAANSPFYNPVPKHDFNVGYDMNHESPDTKAYVSRILRYWLTEFKFDGYRFDLSKGFTQKNTLGNTAAWGNYDQSRIDILSTYFDTIKSVNPQACLILEHFADNSEETVLANKGMMLWGNINNNYCEAAMGYTTTSDLSWGSYKQRGWSQPNLVSYMESHDEERQMFKCIQYGAASGSYTTKDTATALKRAALTATFFYTIPGPKMLWQFGERGYDYSINYPSGTSASRLDNKPPRWDYMKNDKRIELYDLVSSLIKLHKENPIFETTDFDYNLTGAMKQIRLRNDTSSMVVLGNFDVKDGSITANFYNTGKWYEFFSGDSLDVTSTDLSITLKAGEYRIYTNTKLPFPYQVNNNEPGITSVNVIPNPVYDICKIDIKHPGISTCGASIFDITGKQISTIFNGQMNSTLSLQWNPPSPGIYILKVQTGNQVTIKKIIASHK
jgi:1,4-alpha-glucan branching enzyme